MQVAHAALTIPFLIFITSVTHAENLKPLINEPSRKELFSELIRKKAEKIETTDTVEFKLRSDFYFPKDALYDETADAGGTEKKARTDSIFGIDLSHYTPSNFPIASLSKKQIRFTYLKATQGTGYMDGKFTMFWKELDKLPKGQQIHRGAYHFLSAEKDAKAQASTFVEFLSQNGGLKPTDMPPVMDLEWDKASMKAKDRWQNKTADQIVAAAKAWLEEVEKQTGRRPMIYTSLVWWRERVGSDRLAEFSAYPLWIADYSASSRAVETLNVPKKMPWALWQYTENARMTAGFEGGFDANIFKGKEADFYSKLNLQRFEP
ncbi:GH25 family lysozyme [Duganella sp. Dugasp56]|uniref:GH25 family lysozyme n=1 Tax=Duganella sp. Dugasp56 TaxID=3243046 RepID=UPI0039AEEF3E